MLTSATLPALFLLLAGIFGPERWRPWLLGCLMSFYDAALIFKPVPLSLAWVGLIGLAIGCYRPGPAALVRTAMSFWGMLLLALIAYDLLATFAATNVFAGRFFVMPSESMFQVALARPVGFTSSHFDQFGYLGIGVFCALMIGGWFSERNEPERFDRLQAMILAYVLTVVAVCLWELLHKATGLFYPEALIHSGARARAWEQGLGGVSRISGPFSEPSGLATFLAIALATLTPGLMLGRRRLACLVALLLGLFVLLRSTSTTGFGLALPVTALAIGASLYSQMMALREGRSPRRALARITTVIIVSTIILLFAVQLLLAIASSPEYAQLFDKMLFNKTRSGSYVNRIFANELGIGAMLRSYGVGIGLGGHLANSGLITLAACLGVFGVLTYALFFGAAASLPLRVSGDLRHRDDELGSRLTAAALALMLAITFTAASANATQIWIWICFGLAIGLWPRAGSGIAAPRQAGWMARRPPS